LLINRQFKITWNAGSELDLLKYHIYRSEAYYDGFLKVGEVSVGTEEYIDTISKNWGLQWWYKVTALNNVPTPEESDLEDTVAVPSYPQDGFQDEPDADEEIDGDLPGTYPETS